MGQQASFIFSFALILACSFMMTALGLANFPENSLIFGGQDPDIGKCLSTLQSVNGCVQEVIASFFSLKVNLIGNSCCKTFNEIDTNCWLKVFPLNPFFPVLLKNYCAGIAKADAPTPPAPTTTAPSPQT